MRETVPFASLTRPRGTAPLGGQPRHGQVSGRGGQQPIAQHFRHPKYSDTRSKVIKVRTLTMSPNHRVEIRKQSRLLDDFFKVEEVIVAHERHDGAMSTDERRLVFERGDAIAVLLFDEQARSVIVVEQFRLPALIARRRGNAAWADGWMTELVAGMIDQGESAMQAAIRETFEETGYRIDNPRPIGTFFSSPGGSSERFFMYFARERGAA
jgi:nudix-type nucleoside diphosphatase (YffH/AdpP family)